MRPTVPGSCPVRLSDDGMRGIRNTLRSGQTPLSVAPLRFVDIETTGLRPDRGARITEIAVVSPGDPSSPDASDPRPPGDMQIDWTHPPTRDDAHDTAVRRQIARLMEIARECVLVGHNVTFDLRFVAYEARRLGVSGFTARFVDTLPLARTHLPDVADHQLSTLATALDLSIPGTLHTARTDAIVTRAVFAHLASNAPLSTLADAGLQRVRWA